MRPWMMASLSGRKEARKVPPSMYLMAATLKPATSGCEALGMATLRGLRFLKLAMARRRSALALSSACASSKGRLRGADGLGDVAGGHHLGMVGLRDLRQAGHAALHVGDEHLDRAGDDRQLLLEEVAGDRDAVANEDLVGRAADAGEGHALGARGLGFGDDLRVAGSDGEHFGQGRLMAVHEDVHRLRAQHPEIGAAPHR